jgi:3',5'-cyclic AMP phosphodiesterase CpdA
MRIAHLSDVHTLEPKDSFGWVITCVSMGRAMDPAGRVRKLAAGLRAAKNSGADHVVISGDLTEMGSPVEYETFATVLHDSRIDPNAVTLVPGNHDAYTSPDGWRAALAGPLRAFAAGSATEPGKVVDRGDVVFLPIDLSLHQSVVRSGGALTDETATAVERRLADPALKNRPVVLVQHHPPVTHRTPVWAWIDGVRGMAHMMNLLVRHAHAHLLHGHLHRLVDRVPLGIGRGRSRIFGAPAIVDDAIDAPRVRLYEVEDGGLTPAGLST